MGLGNNQRSTHFTAWLGKVGGWNSYSLSSRASLSSGFHFTALISCDILWVYRRQLLSSTELEPRHNWPLLQYKENIIEKKQFPSDYEACSLSNLYSSELQRQLELARAMFSTDCKLWFSPAKRDLIDTSPLIRFQWGSGLDDMVVPVVKIVGQQWSAATWTCTFANLWRACFCVPMHPHNDDPGGQLVDPMSRKFSATHLEPLDHFEHVKAGHRWLQSRLLLL